MAALPSGWAAHVDPEGRTYYHNVATNDTQWDPPVNSTPAATAVALDPLPLGWTEHADPATGNCYFHSSATGETSWTRPAIGPASALAVDELPEGWAEHHDPASGNTFYHNAASGETSWTRPALVTGNTTAPIPTAPPIAAADWVTAAPSTAGAWSTSNTYTLGDGNSDYLYVGKVPILPRDQYSSVARTVDALNAGVVTGADLGYCTVFSSSQQLFFLLWRDGMDSVALSALGISDFADDWWSVDQAKELGGRGSEHIFSSRVALSQEFDSVSRMVAALNSGQTDISIGYCVMFSESKQQYFILWRWDKKFEAFGCIALDPDC